MEGNRGICERLSRKIDELSYNIEKAKIADYVSMMENRRQMLFLNFIGGIARGLGIAVGFSLLGALAIYLLRRLVLLNLPLIGDFIAELIKIVNRSM